MNRMIVIWCSLIFAVLIGSAIVPTWSMTNPWTINAIILFVLLLFIEIGLVYYQRRTQDLDAFIKQSRINQHYNHQDNHYIKQQAKEDK